MRELLRYPTGISTFFLSMAVQHILLFPMTAFFIFSPMVSGWSVWAIAEIPVLAVALVTLVLMVTYLVITWRENVSVSLPVSFLLFSVLLTMFSHLLSRFRTYEQLPYEWGEYTELVWYYFSLPLALLSALLVAGFKVANYVRERRADASPQ